MNPTQPGKIFWLVVLAGFWALYGLTGRDAWQTEEALALAPILDWLTGSATPWAAPAPFHALVAGLFARAAPFGLDIQDSARLASGLFTLVTLLATAFAARGLLGIGFGAPAALALLGGFGWMLRAHALIPETAWLAVWACLLWGMALARSQPKAGGMLFGVCLAILTLGLRGLPDLAAGLVLLLAPLALRDWRETQYRRALKWGLGMAVALILAGMAVMAQQGQLDAWVRWHGMQRFVPTLAATKLLSELAWFAWPLWPLALAALWHDHRRLGRAPALHLPLIAVVVFLPAALLPAWSRVGALLPLLLPLTLLAALALAHLRRGAAQGFYWFGALCFLFFGVAFWVYFAAIEWGMPAKLAAHVARLTPSYRPGAVDEAAIWLAAGASLLWLVAIPLFPRAQTRPVLVWGTGMLLVWVLLASLFRPWAEAGWGYRPMIADMARHLPSGACLAADVEPGVAAMLRYHLAGRNAVNARADCPWRLGQVPRVGGKLAPKTDHTVWQGFRPRYKGQVYRLEHLREE
ncbi:MAG: hypothetical protein AB1831_10810 [Pseudomonadota bacterium]